MISCFRTLSGLFATHTPEENDIARHYYGDAIAWIVYVGMFAFAHAYGGLSLAINALILGLLSTFLNVRTRSLLPGILVWPRNSRCSSRPLSVANIRSVHARPKSNR